MGLMEAREGADSADSAGSRRHCQRWGLALPPVPWTGITLGLHAAHQGPPVTAAAFAPAAGGICVPQAPS
jgi:hypothetical protein